MGVTTVVRLLYNKQTSCCGCKDVVVQQTSWCVTTVVRLLYNKQHVVGVTTVVR